MLMFEKRKNICTAEFHGIGLNLDINGKAPWGVVEGVKMSTTCFLALLFVVYGHCYVRRHILG